MKKIGIVTIIGDYNYGNRLQNYALHKVLSDMGYYVETINFKYFDNTAFNRLKLLVRNIVVKLGIKRYKRNKSFNKFNKLINFSNYVFKDSKINAKYYDFFICGSDQIWNYNFNEFDKRLFLNFSERKKNIAYAASYGINKIPDELKKIYIDNLKNFKNISLREEDGQELTKELTGKEFPIVLDPTLLISREQWEKLSISYPRNKNYIVVYILGDDLNDIIEKCFTEYEIIYLNNKNDKKTYNYGPYEFLGIIKNAQFIITDSYHACIFSIIFEKKFAVLDRIINKEKCMEGRINTILKLFNLQFLKVNSIDEIKKRNLIDYNIDYNYCKKILKIEKSKSLKFLKDNLEQGD